MPDSKPNPISPYDRFIQRLRIGFAWGLAIGGLSLVSLAYGFRGSNLSHTINFGLVILLAICVIGMLLLMLEQVLTVTIRHIQPQFSIKFMLVLTTLIACVAGLASYSPLFAIGFVAFLLLMFALGTENQRTPTDSSRKQSD